jgi:hypothetical protein
VAGKWGIFRVEGPGRPTLAAPAPVAVAAVQPVAKNAPVQAESRITKRFKNLGKTLKERIEDSKDEKKAQ